MKKSTKRKLSIALSAMLMLSAAPYESLIAVSNPTGTEASQSSYEINGTELNYDYYPESEWETAFSYIIENGEVELRGLKEDYTYYSDDLIIPALIEGCPVTKIAAGFFLPQHRKGLAMRSVAIPPTVTEIGEQAFGYLYEYMNPIDPAATTTAEPGVTTTATLLSEYKGERYGYFTGTYYANQMYEWFGCHMKNGFAIIGYEGTAAYEYSRQTETVIGHTYEFGFIPISKMLNKDDETYPDEKLWSTNVLNYVTENGEVTITGLKFGYNMPKNMIIPENINGVPVTAIAKAAFIDESLECQSITIPKTVTHIGDMAIGYIAINTGETSISQGCLTGTTMSGYEDVPPETMIVSEVINLQGYVVRNGFEIIGYEGSAAEEYAKKTSVINGTVSRFKFTKVGDSTVYTTEATSNDITEVSTIATTPLESSVTTIGTSSLNVPTTYEADAYRYGDINLDGIVTATDIVSLLKHFLKAPELTGDAYKYADVTGDGLVNLQDLATFKQFLMGDKVAGRLNREAVNIVTDAQNKEEAEVKALECIRGYYGFTSMGREDRALLLTNAEDFSEFCKPRGDNYDKLVTNGTYDSTFFKEYDIAAIEIASSSGSIKHKFNRVEATNKNATFFIDTYIPQAQTCDIAEYIMLVALPKGWLTNQSLSIEHINEYEFSSDEVKELERIRVNYGTSYINNGEAPIMIFNDAESFSEFCDKPDEDYKKVTLSVNYGSDFFAKYDMAAVQLSASSGSIFHQFSRLEVSENTATFFIDTYMPEIGTCDMAEYIMLIAVPKGLITDQTLSLSGSLY